MPKISDLPELNTPADDDMFVINDDSVSTTKRISVNNIRSWLQSLIGWINTNMVADNSITAGKIEVQQSWITPTLKNGWVYYGSPFNQPGYMKDSLGFVHIRGLVRSGTDGAVIFTLPSGYRPQNQELMSISSVDLFGRLDIDTSGNIIPSTSTTSPGWVCLDGVIFKAYQ